MRNGGASSSRSLVKNRLKTHEGGNGKDFARKVGKAERGKERSRGRFFNSRVEGTTKGVTILRMHVVIQTLVEVAITIEVALENLTLGMMRPELEVTREA